MDVLEKKVKKSICKYNVKTRFSHLPKHLRADIDHRCDGDDYLNGLYHDYDIKNRVQDYEEDDYYYYSK